jgi:beta-glucosidase
LIEELSRADRFVKGVQAGIDQFGGVTETDQIVQAVEQKRLDMARIDASVRRILVTKFRMGLFENPMSIPRKRRASSAARLPKRSGPRRRRRCCSATKVGCFRSGRGGRSSCAASILPARAGTG